MKGALLKIIFGRSLRNFYDLPLNYKSIEKVDEFDIEISFVD